MACSFKRCNPNKVWVDQDSKFKNHLFKKFLKNNNIAMHSTCNEKKPVLSKDLSEKQDLQAYDSCFRGTLF